MEKPPTPTRLANAVGISVPYASQLLSGTRPMARSLAVHIFQTVGWRHESIADLTDTQIAFLQSIEPWTPRKAAEEKAEAA